MSNNRGWKRFLAMLLSVTMLLSIVSIGYAEGATAQPAEVAETVAPAEEAPAELPSVDEIIVDVNRPETAWDEGDDFDLTAKAGSTLKAKISANAFQGEFINSQGILSLGAGGKYTFKVSDFEIVSGTTTANPELELVAVSVKRNSTKYIAYNRTEFRIKGNKANGMATVRVKVREKGTDNECVLDVKAKKVGAPTTFAISPATVIAPAEGATYVLTQGGLKGGVSQADTMLEVNPPVNAEVTYTVSPADGAVTVDANGKVTVAPVTAETLGAKYTVTATSYNGKKATLTINMAEEPVEPASKLVVTADKTQLPVGKDSTVKLTASVQGEAVSLEGIKWKVDNAAATLKVDEADPTEATLTVPKTIVTPGKITVTATAADLTGTAVIELDYAVEKVEIDESALKGYATEGADNTLTYLIPEGAKVQLTAKVTLDTNTAPSAAKYTGSIVWESKYPAVATVDETGLVTVKTGVKDLTTVITATAQNKVDKINVKAIADYNTVKIYDSDAPKTDINGKEIYKTDRKSVTLTAEPAYVAKANKAAVTWSSSDSTLATVTATGSVTFASNDKTGTVVITATAANGATGKVTYILINEAVAADEVVINGFDGTGVVAAGTTLQLSATVYGKADANNDDKRPLATVQDVTWTVGADAYATIDKDTGLLTVKSWQGANKTVTVTATSKQDTTKKDTVKLTIVPYAITSIALDLNPDDAYVKDGKLSGAGTEADPYVLDSALDYGLLVSVEPAGNLGTLYTLSAVNAKTGAEIGILNKTTITASSIPDEGAIITATATDGSGKSASIYVTKGAYKIEIEPVNAVVGDGTEANPYQVNDTEIKFTATVTGGASYDYRYTMTGTTDWITVSGGGNKKINAGAYGKTVKVEVRSTDTPSTTAVAYFTTVKSAAKLTASDITVEVVYGEVVSGDGSASSPWITKASEKVTGDDPKGANEVRVKVSVKEPFSLSNVTVTGADPVDAVNQPGVYKLTSAADIKEISIAAKSNVASDSSMPVKKYVGLELADYNNITAIDIAAVDGKDVAADNSAAKPLMLMPEASGAAYNPVASLTVKVTPDTTTDTVNLTLEQKNADGEWVELATDMWTRSNKTLSSLKAKFTKTPGAEYRITAQAARSDASDVVYVSVYKEIKAMTVSAKSGINTSAGKNHPDDPYIATVKNPVVSIAVTDPATGYAPTTDAVVLYKEKRDDEYKSTYPLGTVEAGWDVVDAKVDGTIELNLEVGKVYEVRVGLTEGIAANATSNVLYVKYPGLPITKAEVKELTVTTGDCAGTGTQADPYVITETGATGSVTLDVTLKYTPADDADTAGLTFYWDSVKVNNVSGLEYNRGYAVDPDKVLDVQYKGESIGKFYFRFKYDKLEKIELKVEGATEGDGTAAKPYVVSADFKITKTLTPSTGIIEDVKVYKIDAAKAPADLPATSVDAELAGFAEVTDLESVSAPDKGKTNLYIAFDESGKNGSVPVATMYVTQKLDPQPAVRDLSFDVATGVKEDEFKAISNDKVGFATDRGVVQLKVTGITVGTHDYSKLTATYAIGFFDANDAFISLRDGTLSFTEKDEELQIMTAVGDIAEWGQTADIADVSEVNTDYVLRVRISDDTGATKDAYVANVTTEEFESLT